MKNYILKKVVRNPEVLDENGSALPYVLGWFMGVPMSVLILIALLRSC